MSTAKPEREYVNPKWMIRQIGKACPRNLPPDLRETVRALWAFCDDFLDKADLEAGQLMFHGSVSYTQLDEYFGTGKGTAKQRMERLRDDYGLVTWRRGRYNIHFSIGLGYRNPDSSEGTEYLTGLAEVNSGESSEGTGDSSQGTEEIESGYENPSEGTEAPSQGTDTLLCLSGLGSGFRSTGNKQTGDASLDDLTDEDQKLTPNPAPTTSPTGSVKDPRGAAPNPAEGTSRPRTPRHTQSAKAERVPPAAPRCEHGVPEQQYCSRCVDTAQCEHGVVWTECEQCELVIE
jgi:hypothetical protein